LRQLVKERSPQAALRSVDRWPVPMRKPVGVGNGNGNGKRPGSFRNPGLCVQRFEGALLGAPLSRMHSVLAPIKLREGAWLDRRKGRMQGRAARRQRSHRRSTCERDQTLHGSAGSDGAAGIHDGILEKLVARLERVGTRQTRL
jgi:hypothetical protein